MRVFCVKRKKRKRCSTNSVWAQDAIGRFRIMRCRFFVSEKLGIAIANKLGIAIARVTAMLCIASVAPSSGARLSRSSTDEVSVLPLTARVMTDPPDVWVELFR